MHIFWSWVVIGGISLFVVQDEIAHLDHSRLRHCHVLVTSLSQDIVRKHVQTRRKLAYTAPAESRICIIYIYIYEHS